MLPLCFRSEKLKEGEKHFPGLKRKTTLKIEAKIRDLSAKLDQMMTDVGVEIERLRGRHIVLNSSIVTACQDGDMAMMSMWQWADETLCLFEVGLASAMPGLRRSCVAREKATAAVAWPDALGLSRALARGQMLGL
jgi:hypothetical protein